jgi:hypothetical protein
MMIYSNGAVQMIFMMLPPVNYRNQQYFILINNSRHYFIVAQIDEDSLKNFSSVIEGYF